MIYTIENTAKIGKPVIVFDADGVEVTHCVRCDTETGEVERFEVDINGRYVFDEAGGSINRVKEVLPRPLRVVQQK